MSGKREGESWGGVGWGWGENTGVFKIFCKGPILQVFISEPKRVQGRAIDVVWVSALRSPIFFCAFAMDLF